MQYFTKKTNIKIKERTVVTLGKFDGLHRGHQKLLSRVLDAGKNGFRTVVFTFDRSPRNLISGEIQQSINTNEERKLILEDMGIEYLVEYPFTSRVAQMDARHFIEQILLKQMNVAYIIVGNDFRFGHNRTGDVNLLTELSKEYAFQLTVMDKAKEKERVISSTYIKEELIQGNIAKVNELLGYPYFIHGTVIHGRQLGRTIGTPTINIIPSPIKLLPPNGVYASRTSIDGKTYCGITNIGLNPTIEGEHFVGVETFLFDFEGDLYGKDLDVLLFAFLRPEIKFSSIEALKTRVSQDAQAVRRFFNNK